MLLQTVHISYNSFKHSLIKYVWVYGLFFKPIIKFLEQVCRSHINLTPSTCFFYSSFARKDATFKVPEDTFYLINALQVQNMHYILHPYTESEACFQVYLCGNKHTKWHYSQFTAVGGQNKELLVLYLNDSHCPFIVQITVWTIPNWPTIFCHSNNVFPSSREDTQLFSLSAVYL